MTLPSRVILQQSWVWEKEVIDFFSERIEGHSLNVCCGLSELGDVRVDIDPKDFSVAKADMKDLPFDSNTFDTVFSDPPWKIGFYDRFRPFFEMVRVAKVGGLIMLNAYWIPTAANVSREEIWVKAKRDFTNTSIISLFRKTRDELLGELPKKYRQTNLRSSNHKR